MDNNPLDLAHEFPEFKGQIAALKAENQHFRRLFERYGELNRRIIRFEQRVEVVASEVETAARRERLALKDELHGMLAKA